MKREKLIAWQWSDYFSKHSNKANLVLHVFAVPLFWIGSFGFIAGAFGLNSILILKSLALMFLSVAVQGLGHKLEKETPTPFLGGVDFLSRFLTEQFITFPRYFLTGGWLKAILKRN